MKIRDVAVLFWAVLCLGVLSCFSQSSPSREQQIELHNRKAGEYLRQNRPDLAVPEFKAILDLDPKNVDAHGNLGTVLFFQGDYTNAIPQLRAALKLRPTLWRTEALLGRAEKRTGDTDRAKHDLDKAFSNLTEEKVRTETGMELIEIYSRTGDLDKAAATVELLRKLEPTDPAILYTGYRIYSDLAAEALLSLSVVDPNSARMHQAIAHELAKRGSTAQAIENYRAALKLDPHLPGLHFELAEMLSTLSTADSREEAEREYRSALEADPLDEQSERRLADIALDKGDLKEAKDRYSRAVQLQPGDPEASIGLAKVLMAGDNLKWAEPLLKHALELDPTSAVAHFRLSTVYRQTGRIADAKHELEEYQKYKTMKEKLQEIYQQLGMVPASKEDKDTDSKK